MSLMFLFRFLPLVFGEASSVLDLFEFVWTCPAVFWSREEGSIRKKDSQYKRLFGHLCLRLMPVARQGADTTAYYARVLSVFHSLFHSASLVDKYRVFDLPLPNACGSGWSSRQCPTSTD